MRIGGREFDTENHTYVMGILNVTPDSFSDGGKYCNLDKALSHAEEMIAEGAGIIDIGGESTRPGYILVPDSEEAERIAPVIEAVKSRFDIPVSVDTYKSVVAKAAIEAGADMVNDIWGLKHDVEIAGVIAKSQAACCLMHNRKSAEYQDFRGQLLKELGETIKIAETAGIGKDKIILDPGVGFGKTYEQNLLAIKHLDDLQGFGYPILLGTSKKSVIGITLGIPVTERMVGTAVTTVFAVLSGCSFVRVHDVKENVQAILMAEAIRDA